MIYTKEQLLDLKIKSKQYVISTTPQRTYWKDDLLLKLKNSVDPTLKTTIANGKYAICLKPFCLKLFILNTLVVSCLSLNVRLV